MTPHDERHAAFRKYVSAVDLGGTTDERQAAWDRYWRLELADVAAQAAEARAAAKRRVKAAA